MRTLDGHGLGCIGGFVTAVLHDTGRRAAELASVERQATMLRALGSHLLVLAPATGRDGYEERTELTDAEWATLFATLPLVEAIAHTAGLEVVVHPHVGTVIEQPQDIERLLAGSHVALCLDTGHVFVGGGDPAAVARRAGRRVRHVHLKDASGPLASAVRDRRLSYAAAVQRGLFTPLGDGDAHIADVLTILREGGYDGWFVLEQDVALKDAKADPLPGIERSLTFVSARV